MQSNEEKNGDINISEDESPTQNKQNKNLDDYYEIMGNGKYQYTVTVLFAILYILWAIFFMTPGLFFQEPVFKCNGKLCKDQDQYCALPDNQREIVKGHQETITQEFEIWNSVGESLPFLGSIFGLFFFMYISDNKGRKLAIGASWLVGSIGGIFVVAINNIIPIYIGLFFVGFGVVPAATVGLVFLNEITIGKFRSVSVCMMYVAFGGAELLIWPFSLIAPNWRYFNLFFLTIPYVVMNCVYFIIYETPKFMIGKDQDTAVSILNKMLKRNNKKIVVESENLEKVDTTSGKEKQYSYIDLFRYKSVRRISICLTILSFGIHALYYGIQFSLDLIGADFAKNTFFVGIADFLGYIISDLACPRFKRKRWLIVTLFLTSLFCFSFLIDPVPENCKEESESCIEKTMQIWQAVLARFVISFSFSFMVLWMNELYPTTIRSSGLGLVLLVGLAGAQVTPFIKTLCAHIGINFLFVLGFFGIIGCSVSFFIKETFNHPILDEIPELTLHHQHDLSDDEDEEDEERKNSKSEDDYSDEGQRKNSGPLSRAKLSVKIERSTEHYEDKIQNKEPLLQKSQ